MTGNSQELVSSVFNSLKQSKPFFNVASLTTPEAIPSTQMTFSLENVRRLITEDRDQSTSVTINTDPSRIPNENNARNINKLASVFTLLSGELKDSVIETRARLSDSEHDIQMRILFKNGAYGMLKISRADERQQTLTPEAAKSVTFDLQGNKSSTTRNFLQFIGTTEQFRIDYPIEVNL